MSFLQPLAVKPGHLFRLSTQNSIVLNPFLRCKVFTFPPPRFFFFLLLSVFGPTVHILVVQPQFLIHFQRLEIRQLNYTQKILQLHLGLNTQQASSSVIIWMIFFLGVQFCYHITTMQIILLRLNMQLCYCNNVTHKLQKRLFDYKAYKI